MAFDPPALVSQNVILCPVGNTSLEDLRSIFMAFDISLARCYDPNEQARVQSVVSAIGPDRFNNMVRDLGKAYMGRNLFRSSQTGLKSSAMLVSSQMSAAVSSRF